MITLEQKIDLIMRHAVAEDPELKNHLRNEIVRVLSDTSESTTDISSVTDNVINDVIEDLLKELGAPCHLSGYEQTIYAMKLIISDSDYLEAVTYKLYPTVAKKFHSTPSRVERNIRHVIESAWSRQDLENAYRIFGNTISIDKGKPTNSEFLACCAKVVKRRIRHMNQGVENDV